MSNSTQALGRVPTTRSTTLATPAYYICLIKMDTFEQYMFVYLFRCFIRPAICVLGFSLNMFCIAILRRNGLHKQPNILLCGQIIADSIYLLFGLNYSSIIQMFGPNRLYPAYCGLQYNETLDYSLLISQIIFKFSASLGFYASTLIPILITLERLMAIFRPMAFKAVVTTRITKIAVISSFIVWIPWILCDLSFHRILSAKLSSTITFMELVPQDSPAANVVAVMTVFVVNSGVSFFTLAAVTIGCCIISIKMSIALKQRRRLTTSQSKLTWSPRTTRTLLVTCFIFVVIHGTITICASITDSLQRIQYFFVNDIKYYIYPINASSNLFVCILTNKKLLHNLKNILRIAK
ncbi:G-protein coupled receptor [Biomphalaria pfeifferi]|uniref:G-protein coupled receptor n=1 Tax=Biomphalaria pfeifferi TaxID=112525 RepID=A0AAD8FK34_BIOPF|nr:G-protein coupled receptor [Biomphalaria pfeifferi]